MNMLLYQSLAFTIHEILLKKSYKTNKFEISAPTWNKEFELPDETYLFQIFQIALNII